jgi:hypothetical protein
MSSIDLEFIEVDWDADPRILAASFQELADNLERNLDEPAIAARQIMIDDVREHFEKEEGPLKHWDPWAPSYAQRAQRENIGILRKTEDLFDATQEISSWPIIGNDVWVNTNSWPDYWRIQQEGGRIGGRMTSRRMAIRRYRGDKEADTFGVIPPRPYIWTSQSAEEQIAFIYDRWVEGELQIVINPLFGFAQTRLPSGVYGKKIGRRPSI